MDDRRQPEEPLPDMNHQKSRTMWIAGYILLAVVIAIALYSFIAA